MRIPFLTFTGTITPGRIENLVGRLRLTNAPECVAVDSPGGQFEFFSVAAPGIQRRGLTMLADDVCSSAVVLFLLGARRYAFPSSTFFFHGVRAVIGGSTLTIGQVDDALAMEEVFASRQREALEEWRRQMRVAQQWLVSFIASSSQLSTSAVQELMAREVTLSAREALRYGLVQAIIADERHQDGLHFAKVS